MAKHFRERHPRGGSEDAEVKVAGKSCGKIHSVGVSQCFDVSVAPFGSESTVLISMTTVDSGLMGHFGVSLDHF